MYALEDWTACRWQKENRTYSTELVQDLFGDWQVVRSWGSINTRHGNRQTIPAADYEEARALLEATRKRRHARGYIETTA